MLWRQVLTDRCMSAGISMANTWMAGRMKRMLVLCPVMCLYPAQNPIPKISLFQNFLQMEPSFGPRLWAIPEMKPVMR